MSKVYGFESVAAEIAGRADDSNRKLKMDKNKLIEVLEAAQSGLNFFRNDLLYANKIAAEKNPVAGMVIADLLAQETALAIKLNELTSLLST